MKKIALLMIFAGLSYCVSAQSIQPDTISSITNANSLTVIKEGSATRILIEGKESEPDFYYSLTTNITDSVTTNEPQWEPSFPFLREKPKSPIRYIWARDLYLGIAMPIDAPAGLDNSIEFGFGSIAGIEYRPWRKGPRFSIGIGIHYRQFTLHDSQVFQVNDHVLSIVPVEADKVSSRFRNFGFQIPFAIFQPIAKNFGITIGVSAMFNTYTRVASDHIIGDKRYHRSMRGLHQRLLTPELFAHIGWKDDIGLFVRYSPTPLFEEQWGPQFRALSAGITIAM